MHRLRFICQRTLAALTLFTRLPLWRLCRIDAEHYRHVVPLWPLAGWVTGGSMVGVAWLAALAGLPLEVGVVLCMCSRVLLTGALHEDGFADFCDGFGGGTSRQRTLEIMKDSHIGTYGVLGLVLYYLLLWNLLTVVLDRTGNPWMLLVADTCCKGVSSLIIHLLSYARKEEEAKIRTTYAQPGRLETLTGLLLGLLPLCVYTLTLRDGMFLLPFLGALLTALLLFAWMRRRIQGYTGDCCGATFILTEMVFYLLLAALL